MTDLTLPPPQEWALMKEAGAMLVRSGFLPRAVDTPEKAVAIMLKGRELGIPPMQAFSHIAIVEGKPTISAELMRAQVFSRVPGATFEIELSPNGCKILAGRPGHKPTEFSWGPEEARAAGLLNKQNWQKYPKAMYLARCTSEACRAVFPDAIAGASYTPEELDPDLPVNDAGVVEVVAKPAVEEKKAEPVKELEQPQMSCAAKTAGQGKVFEDTKEQRKIIEGILAKRPDAPRAIWESIFSLLKGRPSGDLALVIAEANRRAAVAARKAEEDSYGEMASEALEEPDLG